MIRINLLPVKISKKQEILRQNLIVLGVSIGLTIAACGYFWYSTGNEIDQTNRAIVKTQKEIDELAAVVNKVEEAKNKKDELAKKKDIIEKLIRDRQSPVHVMDDIVNAIPDRAWLTNYEESGPSLKLTGLALDESTIVEFIKRLKAKPHFTNVRYDGSEKMDVNNQRLKKFTFTCTVNRSTLDS